MDLFVKSVEGFATLTASIVMAASVHEKQEFQDR